MSDEKIRLGPRKIDLESVDVEELEPAAGGAVLQSNCYSCTCPEPPHPIVVGSGD